MPPTGTGLWPPGVGSAGDVDGATSTTGCSPGVGGTGDVDDIAGTTGGPVVRSTAGGGGITGTTGGSLDFGSTDDVDDVTGTTVDSPSLSRMCSLVSGFDSARRATSARAVAVAGCCTAVVGFCTGVVAVVVESCTTVVDSCTDVVAVVGSCTGGRRDGIPPADFWYAVTVLDETGNALAGMYGISQGSGTDVLD